MNRRLPIAIFIITLIATLTACNSSEENIEIDPFYTDYSNVALIGFSLKPDANVCPNLDSVFFTIDLDHARIYNADSLPKGTDISHLLAELTTPTYYKSIDYIVPLATGGDTTYSYESENNDSLDFSLGGITLRIVSFDEKVTINYHVEVNVHKEDPDSLHWGLLAQGTLPTTLGAINEHRTVLQGDTVVCITTFNRSIRVATSADPYADDWVIQNGTLPAGYNIETLQADTNCLYIIANGTLYRSDDHARTWTSTGASMNHIYGCFQGSVIGNVVRNNEYYHTTYPATVETLCEENFPISLTSLPLTFATKWSTTPQMMFVGGRLANAKFSNGTWAYDGNKWLDVSIDALPEGGGYSFFPYFTFSVNNQWQVSDYETLFAFGGISFEGCDKTLWMSRDRGIHWVKADNMLQFPEGMTDFANAQAFVLKHEVSDSRSQTPSNKWTSIPLPPVPSYLYPTVNSLSRTIAPITSWECPFIYVFGGRVNVSSTQLNRVICGYINRLYFAPLY